MLQDFTSNEPLLVDVQSQTYRPPAQAWVDALAGCCHPRAERLAQRLLACDQPDTMRQLQGDVLNLLVLSFGPIEARRRLQTLQ
jgi:hypothetical protein